MVFGILFFIFCLQVWFKYLQFQDFKHAKSHILQGIIETKYQKISKKNKPYYVLRLKSNDNIIYTTSWRKRLHVDIGDEVSFHLVSKNISFLDYFAKRFYAPAFKFKKISSSKTLRKKIQDFIQIQHKNPQMAQLYSALFLATPINKSLRKKIQNWGISHLVAISGFHLGVLYAVFFFILKMIYGFFQNKYFPYKNANFDIGILLFFVLAFYAFLIDFAPSFLRALMMSLVGFIFYIRYFKVLSFTTLSLSVGLLLAFFPSLSLSLGFWFSVMGVFYIFLYFHHFKNLKLLDGILINIWVFLAMIIPIHGWFGYTSWQQFGAIILSIVFIVFYPFAIFLHIIGYGDLLDNLIVKLLDIQYTGIDIKISFWIVGLYLALSILSIFNRFLAIFLVLCGFGFFVYLDIAKTF